MKVAVEKQDKHVANIQLEIPGDHAAQEYGKACKRIGQRINIPGFRRGKAPRSMIEKTVGVDRIKQEAMDRLLPHLFADAISEHQLEIVAPPTIESFTFDLNEGIQVKAQVELRPEVTLCDLSGLKVDVPKYETPADAEDKELQTIVERMTTLEPVIDRAVIDTDIIHLDFTGSINGELIRGGAAKNFRLDLANNNFIDGFAAQVPGHKLGEEFTIKVEFPKDYHDNTLAGKQADFLIKINEIKKKVVPDLTDDLAKKIGPYESVAQLKEEIGRFLKQNEDQENLYRKQKAVIDAVTEKCSVEIPDAMVNREAKLLMDEVQQRFKGQGLSWEQFLDTQGQESIWDNLRGEAQKRIKTSLVFGAISKQENMSVTEEEFSNMVREFAQMRNADEKVIMRQLANHFESAQALSDQILSQKIVDMLIERSEFNFVADTQDGAESKPVVATSEPAQVAATSAPPVNPTEGASETSVSEPKEEFEVVSQD
jgi:trigger factor